MDFPESFLIKNNPPLFKHWVPKGLGILVLVLLFIPAALIGGVYSGNVSEMSSGMGILSEHVLFANFATAVGMMVMGAFVFPITQRFRFFNLLLCGFSLLILLSGICTSTSSVPLIVLCSFIIGMVRMALMVAIIFTLVEGAIGINLMCVLTPPEGTSKEEVEGMNTGRGVALNIFYAFIMSVGQVGSYITSYVAYHFRWQYSYLVMMALAIIGLIALLVILVPNRERDGKQAVLSLPSISAAIPSALFFLALSYILTYGKTYDWFQDTRISIAGCIALVSAGVFILQQSRAKEKFIDFKVCTIPGIILALVCFFLVMILAASSSLTSAIMGLGLKLDTISSAAIGNWQFLGYAIGAAINIVMLLQGIHTRWILALGFALITLSAGYMYFQFQPMVAYSAMILPTVLRSCGMFMIYAFCGYYGIHELKNAGQQISTWIFVMLLFRSVMGPVAGASTYSNAIYHRSQNYIERFAQDVDETSTAAQNFKRTQMGLMYQGKSYDEATQMASLSTKGQVQIQATLVALKEISGWTIWGGVSCILFVLLYPYNGWRRQKVLTH